jgi:hypothetical protein
MYTYFSNSICLLLPLQAKRIVLSSRILVKHRLRFVQVVCIRSEPPLCRMSIVKEIKFIRANSPNIPSLACLLLTWFDSYSEYFYSPFSLEQRSGTLCRARKELSMSPTGTTNDGSDIITFAPEVGTASLNVTANSELPLRDHTGGRQERHHPPAIQQPGPRGHHVTQRHADLRDHSRTHLRRSTVGQNGAGQVPQDLLDPKTPAEVVIRLEARQPVTDPTLGIPVQPPAAQQSKNRLVVLGDSLSHGFQSAAIFNTDLSYPTIIARELGWYDSFLHPEYRAFGGLPLNLEYLARELELRYGPDIPWWELASAVFFVHNLLDQIRVYWEQGPGSHVPQINGIMHNLAVSGYDIRDLMACTAGTERAAMTPDKDPLLHPLVNNAGPLMARYVLESARDPVTGQALTPVQAAKAHGADGGIETLIVFIGGNNALGTVLDLQVRWSDVGYDDPARKGAYNVWRPSHFAAELQELQAQIREVNAQHVIWCTVPHVTIVPIARGIGGKMRPGSRYFPYYTRPWIDDTRFNPAVDPYLTGNQARAIDSAIDMYNDAITNTVMAARRDGLDWLLLDTAGLLDRIATRRYLLDLAARPSWWTPYQLPPQLAALTPPPDSQFIACGPEGRIAGGIFSLDGVHPTTIAYAILAQEFVNVMQAAGVVFYQADGVTPRTAPILIDFGWAIQRDTLISDPLKSVTYDLKLLGWANELLDWVRALAGHL